MPDICVVYGCNSAKLAFHFPKNAGLRKRWVKFVRTTRKWTGPTRYSTICSQHFIDSDFANITQFNMGFAKKLILNADACPSIFLAIPTSDDSRQGGSGTIQQPQASSSMRSAYRKRQVADILQKDIAECEAKRKNDITPGSILENVTKVQSTIVIKSVAENLTEADSPFPMPIKRVRKNYERPSAENICQNKNASLSFFVWPSTCIGSNESVTKICDSNDSLCVKSYSCPTQNEGKSMSVEQGHLENVIKLNHERVFVGGHNDSFESGRS